MATTINKGFIKDWAGNKILPITRGELVLDKDGNIALNSKYFLAGENGTEYGLITAAERAMLNGGGTGNSLADVYTKVGHINAGLQFNGSTLNFYNTSTGAATPINITATPANGITIGGSGNTVSLSLTALTTSNTSVSNILKSITVDKYGRVTAVSGAALTNADIPEELTGKKLKDGTLENFKTLEAEIGTDPKAVANKSYVDTKVAQATNIATGALKFGGAINDATVATGYLNDSNKWNNYFKVTANLSFAKSDFYETTGLTIVGDNANVKIGDTLIIYPPATSATRAQFIYVPSGDELTAVTIRKETADGTADILKVDKGNIILRFSDIFNVTNT